MSCNAVKFYASCSVSDDVFKAYTFSSSRNDTLLSSDLLLSIQESFPIERRNLLHRALHIFSSSIVCTHFTVSVVD